MLQTLAVPLAALSILTAPSAMKSPDGNELLRACTAAVLQEEGAHVTVEQTVLGVWCTGYVGGFLDGLAVMSWKGGSTKVCLPEGGVENGQAIRILVKHLREHPATLHESGRVLIVVAIAQAFPCK